MNLISSPDSEINLSNGNQGDLLKQIRNYRLKFERSQICINLMKQKDFIEIIEDAV